MSPLPEVAPGKAREVIDRLVSMLEWDLTHRNWKPEHVLQLFRTILTESYPVKSKPRLLDLFCGAGGCAVGYHRAGFDVVGIDHRPQSHYPFTFVQADALEYLAEYGREFDVIHASPPCQLFSVGTNSRPEAKRRHPDLVRPTLLALAELGCPWVVENVPLAPLPGFACTLCGLMFGLKVFRHRKFASSHLLLSPAHPRHGARRIGVGGFVCVAGPHGSAGKMSGRRLPHDHRTKASWASAMGIDWMTRNELTQAIPPAYTEYLGRQLRRIVRP